MLYLIFLIGWIAAITGTVCGFIGYVLKENRWVDSVGDYFMNFARMTLQVAFGFFLIWAYVWMFGWPEPD